MPRFEELVLQLTCEYETLQQRNSELTARLKVAEGGAQCDHQASREALTLPATSCSTELPNAERSQPLTAVLPAKTWEGEDAELLWELPEGGGAPVLARPMRESSLGVPPRTAPCPADAANDCDAIARPPCCSESAKPEVHGACSASMGVEVEVADTWKSGVSAASPGPSKQEPALELAPLPACQDTLMSPAPSDTSFPNKLDPARLHAQERSLKVFWANPALSVEELPEKGSMWPRLLALRRLLHPYISSRNFDTIMGVVILMNSITIGLESSYRLRGKTPVVFDVLENAFLVIYLLELASRLIVYGWECFRSGWVIFDILLVFLGVLGSWIIQPIIDNTDAIDPTIQDLLSPVLVLRLFRLFRLARAVRLLVQFRTLWMLIQGLINSGTTIFHTFLLMCMLLYIFSCIGVEIIAVPYQNDQTPFGDIVRRYWGSIPRCMLTLIRFVNLDSSAALYEPMVEEHYFLILFFLPFLLIVSITLMNLVTAVIVEGALEQAREDRSSLMRKRHQQVSRCLPRIRDIFSALDANGDGLLSADEVRNASEDVKEELINAMGCDMSEDSLTMLHHLLDEDGSGEVTADEFCNGLPRLCSSDTPMELFAILRHLQGMRKELRDCLGEDSTTPRKKGDTKLGLATMAAPCFFPTDVVSRL